MIRWPRNTVALAAVAMLAAPTLAFADQHADKQSDAHDAKSSEKHTEKRSDKHADKYSQKNSDKDAGKHTVAVSQWPEVSQKAAKEMMQKYGEPQGVTPNRLVWTDQGPFMEIILLNEAIDHDFPMPHKDALEHVVSYDVPTDKVGALAEFDGSIIVDRTRGTLSARCDSEPHNLLALNLAHDIIQGKKNVDEARKAYGEMAMKDKQGTETHDYLKSLQFEPMPDAGDTDVATVGPQADSPDQAQPAAAQQRNGEQSQQPDQQQGTQSQQQSEPRQ